MTPKERGLARQLAWQPRLGLGIVQGGRRRTPRKGESLEFADMREYLPGDDIRRIDWNAYARHEELNIKLYHDEQNISVSLIVDASASMAPRTPGYWDVLRALATPALAAGDRVTLIPVSEGRATHGGTFQGRGSEERFDEALDKIELAGQARLDEGVRRALPRLQGRGITVVVSDFMEPGFGLEGLRLLKGRRDDLVAVQVLSADDIDPTDGGDICLIDAETDAEIDIHMSDRIVADYRRRLEDQRRRLYGACHGLGRTFLPLDPRRGLVADLFEQGRRHGLFA